MNDETVSTMWKALLFSVTFAVLMLIGAATLADHHVVRYYIDTPETASTYGATCVYVDTPWEPDSRVFCSVDPQKTVDFMHKANTELALTGRK